MKQIILMILSMFLVSACSSTNSTQHTQTRIPIPKPEHTRIIHISEIYSFPLNYDVDNNCRTPPVIKPLELWNHDFRLISVSEEDSTEGVIYLRIIPVDKKDRLTPIDDI